MLYVKWCTKARCPPLNFDKKNDFDRRIVKLLSTHRSCSSGFFSYCELRGCMTSVDLGGEDKVAGRVSLRCSFGRGLLVILAAGLLLLEFFSSVFGLSTELVGIVAVV